MNDETIVLDDGTTLEPVEVVEEDKASAVDAVNTDKIVLERIDQVVDAVRTLSEGQENESEEGETVTLVRLDDSQWTQLMDVQAQISQADWIIALLALAVGAIVAMNAGINLADKFLTGWRR